MIGGWRVRKAHTPPTASATAGNISSPGKRYRVIKAFKDFDRQDHPIGEEWTYIGTAFLPYDDGRSIFVSLDGDTRSGTSACRTARKNRGRSSTISATTSSQC